MERESLPAHDVMGPVTRAIEALSIAAALLLLASHLFRFATRAGAGSRGRCSRRGRRAARCSRTSAPASCTGSPTPGAASRCRARPATCCARSASTTSNPHEFLRRDFIDCNGDVALITCPIFVARLARADRERAPVEARGALPGRVRRDPRCRPTRCTSGRTRRRPPRLVRLAPARGPDPRRARARRHHMPPYVANYCIATGWCNRGARGARLLSRARARDHARHRRRAAHRTNACVVGRNRPSSAMSEPTRFGSGWISGTLSAVARRRSGSARCSASTFRTCSRCPSCAGCIPCRTSARCCTWCWSARSCSGLLSVLAAARKATGRDRASR